VKNKRGATVMRNAAIKRWLATLPEDAEIGVDGGGLTLVVDGDDSYLEVGGMPDPTENASPAPPPPEAEPRRALICNPKVGNVVRPMRSRTGRCWKVARLEDDICVLVPLGDDVLAARSERTGRWQGGVRSLRKPWREIIGWELVRE
jgi:hypothetical protein